jgi:peptidoglycan/LPS O-acetylase OafA/YrhL
MGAQAAIDEAVPRRFDSGDGLRALAALFILVFHVGYLSLASKGFSVAADGEAAISQFRPLFGTLAPEFASMRTCCRASGRGTG